MILFCTLMIVLLAALIVITPVVLTGSIAFIFVFADVIVFVWILIYIIKSLIRKKKEKK